MNKDNLIKASKKYWPDARKMVDAIFKEMNTAFLKRERVVVANFGSFRVVLRKGKIHHNFKTGERKIMSPKYTVKFVISRSVKRMINEKNPS